MDARINDEHTNVIYFHFQEAYAKMLQSRKQLDKDLEDRWRAGKAFDCFVEVNQALDKNFQVLLLFTLN